MVDWSTRERRQYGRRIDDADTTEMPLRMDAYCCYVNN